MFYMRGEASANVGVRNN